MSAIENDRTLFPLGHCPHRLYSPSSAFTGGPNFLLQRHPNLRTEDLSVLRVVHISATNTGNEYPLKCSSSVYLSGDLKCTLPPPPAKPGTSLLGLPALGKILHTRSGLQYCTFWDALT
ncbi:unnamed protein product [Dicrocoelium dendriticum]|nr:unnamed protein product [Dicrocoelium dendriticum]